MNICISSYSFHQAFENDLLDASHFVRLMKEKFALNEVEFYEPDLFVGLKEGRRDITALSPDHKYLHRLQEVCKDAGVSIIAISAQNDFTSQKEAQREQYRKRIERWLAIAPVLGVKFIRINSGNEFLSNPNAETWLFENLSALIPRARANGICLVLENHPRNIRNRDDAKKLLRVINSFDRQDVALCLDNGHIDLPPWRECVDVLLPEARHCHVKFSAFTAEGEESTISYKDFFESVRKSRYRGSFSIEMITSPNRLELSPERFDQEDARKVFFEESLQLTKRAVTLLQRYMPQ